MLALPTMPLRLLLCLGALVLAAACASARPRIVTRVLACPAELAPKDRPEASVNVTTQCIFYELEGRRANELRRFMSAHGPSDETGIYDAYTAYFLRYGYHTHNGEEGCAITSPTVELYLAHTLPSWTPPAEGSEPGLTARWSKYTGRLNYHEAGHANISIRAANDLHEALAALPPANDCGALQAAAHDLFDDALARLKQTHLAYDARTRHGATQGCVFP